MGQGVRFLSSERWAVDAAALGRSLNAFFFFQAEDGIRDLTVTGVQTCALPIYLCHGIVGTAEPTAFLHVRTFPGAEIAAIRVMKYQRTHAGLRIHHEAFRKLRSEERRVGKERRSRWSPYH